MGQAIQVWYVELRGEGGVPALTQVLALLPAQAGFLGAELLTSPEQPGLALIASRWAGDRPAIELPQGAKHWAFQVVATALP